MMKDGISDSIEFDRNKPPLFFVITPSPVKKPFLITLVLLLITGASALFLYLRHQEVVDVRLATPVPLLQELLKSGKPIFTTSEFLPCIVPFPSSQKALFPTLADAEAAGRNKSLFWNLNREYHYGSLLVGASPAWHSLTESLLNSPLWVLTDVSPWGYVFKAPGTGVTAWQIPSEQELRQNWPRPDDRARFLILTAANLAAINLLPEAEQLLSMADALHSSPSLILSTRASIAASRGHWDEATTLSKESLHADSTNTAAEKILIRALIESGHAEEALDRAHELVSRNMEDADALFLLARAANAANSDKEEIEALTQLVSIAKKQNQAVGASLTYLGQAYAKYGDRGAALRTFQEASLAPELSEEQRKMIHDLMDHLMEGNASSSTLPPLNEDKMMNGK